ncbi:MAG: transcription termination/antitermination protein NusG [Cyanobacteria bacterium P01_H01_bin.74]
METQEDELKTPSSTTVSLPEDNTDNTVTISSDETAYTQPSHALDQLENGSLDDNEDGIDASNAVSISDLGSEETDPDDSEQNDENQEGEFVDHRVSVYSEDEAGHGIRVSSPEESPTPVVKIRPKRKKWYIIHTYSGHENKVKINLERRIESMEMADKIFRVEVPQKPVTKIKDGKRTEKDENVFPGYVLVEMLMDDDSWYVVRHTPGVTKFVGSQKKPIAAKDAEIKRILDRPSSKQKAAKVEIDLKVGDIVTIISGPFAGFEGPVTEVSPEKERLKAIVSIFERDTPVELTFSQVEKVR